MVDLTDESFIKQYVDKYRLRGMTPRCRNWFHDRGYCDNPANFILIYETKGGAMVDWILCRHHIDSSIDGLKYFSMIKRYAVHCIHKLRKHGV